MRRHSLVPIGPALVCAVLASACAPQDDAEPRASATPDTSAAASEPGRATSPTGGSTASAGDDVLGDASECENEELRFEVDYPDDWWANERVEPTFEGGTPIPACTYFAAEAIELQPNAGLPPGIAIWFDHETQFEITGTELDRRETEIDGRRTLVVETEGTGGGFEPEGSRTYRYIIDAGDGSVVLGTTSTVYIDAAEYDRAKRILDAMMETLEFGD